MGGRLRLGARCLRGRAAAAIEPMRAGDLSRGVVAALQSLAATVRTPAQCAALPAQDEAAGRWPRVGPCEHRRARRGSWRWLAATVRTPALRTQGQLPPPPSHAPPTAAT